MCGDRSIYRDRLLLLIVKGTNIIHTSSMVFMCVRNQYGIQMTYIFPQHLVTKVWPGIDNNVRVIVESDHDGCTQAFITCIGRLAYRTLARYDGHALGSSCT